MAEPRVDRAHIPDYGIPTGKDGTLSTRQVADVSAYVVKSTGGTVP